jgi:colicin import membrane protein
MLRRHENSDAWKAGMLAIAVHVALLAGMLISINWKAAHPVMNVTEVELWDKIPVPNPPVVKEEPKPEPKPVIKEEPKSEPKVEEKPKPDEPKVDIELEKKKKELEQKEAQKEADEKLKKEKELQAEAREDELKEKKVADKAKKDALKKLQQEALSEEKASSDKLVSAANAGIIDEYRYKIQAKIKANVNKTLCGDGSPEIRVEISVLPTGQISGNPKITKSSENSACDEAVERAIIASEPLPLPDDPDLIAQFRSLKLKFRPND